MFWPVCKAIRLLWRLGELLNNRDFPHRLSPACPPHKPLPPLFHSATTAHHSALSPSTKSPTTVQSPLYWQHGDLSSCWKVAAHHKSHFVSKYAHARAHTHTHMHTRTHTQHPRYRYCFNRPFHKSRWSIHLSVCTVHMYVLYMGGVCCCSVFLIYRDLCYTRAIHYISRLFSPITRHRGRDGLVSDTDKFHPSVTHWL